MDSSTDLTVHLRGLESGEVGLVEKLWMDLYRGQLQMQPGLDLAISGFNDWMAAFEGMIGRFGFIIVAIENGTAIGFVAGRIKLPTPPFAAIPIGFISEIFVDQEHRGKGLGKNLMDLAEDWFSSHEVMSMELQVLTGNHQAREFYESHGWKASVVHMIRNI